MGMSQGAYVGGRAAADQLSPLQDQLRGMQNLQQRYATMPTRMWRWNCASSSWRRRRQAPRLA
jgi:hypothetical protein